MNHAILSAFEGLLKNGTHPSYFLNLEVNPQTIDINIHPTKTEIKFDDEHTLYAILRSAVKHSLGQFNIAPVLDFERDATLDTPYNLKGSRTEAPKIEVDSNFNPFQESKPPREQQNSSFKKAPSEHWESLYVGLESKSNGSASNFSELTFESEESTSRYSKQKSHPIRLMQLTSFTINT
ncbi:DNA mismatch repair protein MutL [Jejuia pallidilutea]|uniref:DNA mismatch repair protein MutL n=1 Tax=Jejuia pallidilutea TaxID=504487 RepID=A0A090VYZ1_9FLAO|nr:DNA mismatch repair protein MutL [Jejuia pallidilutea]